MLRGEVTMIELKAGDLSLTIAPDIGGAIAAFTFRGVELLRPVADPRLRAQHGQAVAAYPLLPYANRIANGRFSLDGHDYQLDRNFGDETGSIHGNGWMRRWQVAGAAINEARLTLDHHPPRDPPGEWPFAFRSEQHFALARDSLRLMLTIENTDARTWPAGIGLHPYVARTPETTLRFEADTLWVNGPDGLPDRRVAAQAATEFSEGRLLQSGDIDCCYAGWGGLAAMAMPEAGITLIISAEPPLDHLQIYAPAGQNFLGVEPVSNMPDAINRIETDADHGLRSLAPGETLTATVEIGVRSSSD